LEETETEIMAVMWWRDQDAKMGRQDDPTAPLSDASDVSHGYRRHGMSDRRQR
jgi:hypothetical protein